MIPTMILVGLVVGRAWAIPAGAVGWAVLLLVTGTIDLAAFPLAALLGGANTAVGVIVRSAARLPLRGVRAS